MLPFLITIFTENDTSFRLLASSYDSESLKDLDCDLFTGNEPINSRRIYNILVSTSSANRSCPRFLLAEANHTTFAMQTTTCGGG